MRAEGGVAVLPAGKGSGGGPCSWLSGHCLPPFPLIGLPPRELLVLSSDSLVERPVHCLRAINSEGRVFCPCQTFIGPLSMPRLSYP